MSETNVNESSIFDGWQNRRVPEPVSEYEKPLDWRKPDVLSFGQKLLDEVDPERNVLPEEMQKRILTVPNDEALMDFLHFNLGSNALTPDLEAASKVFGRLAETPILIPNMLAVWRIYTIAQCLRIIHEQQIMLKEGGMTREERITCHKSSVEAIKALAVLVEKATTYFKQQKLLAVPKKDRSKKKPVITPTKNAPDFG